MRTGDVRENTSNQARMLKEKKSFFSITAATLLIYEHLSAPQSPTVVSTSQCCLMDWRVLPVEKTIALVVTETLVLTDAIAQNSQKCVLIRINNPRPPAPPPKKKILSLHTLLRCPAPLPTIPNLPTQSNSLPYFYCFF